MIEKGNAALTQGIKECWKKCFTMDDPRYIEYFFRYVFQPEYGYADVEDSKVVASACCIPHSIMFNGRILQASMILGVSTLPNYRNQGRMHRLMETIVDACEHSELVTFVQTERPEMYESFGFKPVYPRFVYSLTREEVERITNYGCAYEPSPIDLLKVYSAFIRRFNGFYARDLEYFVRLKKSVAAQGGKIVAYYNEKGQIRGYAVLIIEGREVKIEECIYLDSMSLMKLVNGALQERAIAKLHVSKAENLSLLFPKAVKKEYCTTLARLNDANLFSRLFGVEVHTVEEAFAISSKPLNLNEWE